jgi:acyl-CoA synthetase (NDP forming)
MNDPDVDAVLPMYTQGPLTDPTLIAAKIIKAMKDLRMSTRKPIAFCGVGGGEVERAIRLLEKAGIPAYRSPERAVSSVAALLEYADSRVRVQEKLKILESQ